jgi:hypothetical protein
MDVQKLWMLQLQDMEAEDRQHEYIRHNKFYPNGVFNLTTNPLFYLNSYQKRVRAIRDILLTSGHIRKSSIFYDHRNDIVFYETFKNIYHMCDIANQQVRIINYTFNLK